MALSHARNFVIRHGFHKPNDDLAATHLILIGGKWTIPHAHIKTFYKFLAQDWIEGRHNYVVEMHGDVFPFIIDFDAETEEMCEVGDHIWLDVVHQLQVHMREFFPALSPYKRRVIVMRAPSKVRQRDSGVQTMKTGRHVIYPNVYVTREIALGIRRLLLDRLVLAHLPQLCEVKKEDFIDECIYERNGIRVPYSSKGEVCRDCAASRNRRNREEREKNPETHRKKFYRFPDCAKCLGEGFTHEGRPYTPQWVIDGDCKSLLVDQQRLKVDPYETLCEVSLIGDFHPSPVAGIVSVSAPTLTPAPGKGKKGYSYHARSTGKWKVVSPSSDKVKFIEQFVAANFKKAEIRVVKVSPDGDAYMVPSHERMCPRIGAEHNSNTQFYIIRREGVEQRCYDPDCRTYRSPTKPLPHAGVDLLFPERDHLTQAEHERVEQCVRQRVAAEKPGPTVQTRIRREEKARVRRESYFQLFDAQYRQLEKSRNSGWVRVVEPSAISPFGIPRTSRCRTPEADSRDVGGGNPPPPG